MIQVGQYNTLKVARLVEFGVYLDDGGEGILLPKRFVPAGIKEGDEIEVFVYHDSEDRLIATTQRPLAVAGDFALLRVVSVTQLGAFLDWGLMKDLFVPKSKQLTGMRVGGMYLVKLYVDERTGRVAATEKIAPFLSNEILTVKENDNVDLIVHRRTDIGYVTIINGQHSGVLHFNEVYRNINVGDRFEGTIKKIRPDNTIDVVAGKRGAQKIEDEQDKIIRLLKEHNGYLPFHDKSSPDDIYDFFGMSKKAFKMTLGGLYKKRLITIEEQGIRLLTN